jgi:asparagine synthase (glutamine-hydrolysing)
LDDEVIAHSACITPYMLMANIESRQYFKIAFRDYLPARTLSKPKQGFGLPFNVRAHRDKTTRDLIRDSLEKFKSRGYLKSDFIDQVFTDKLDGGSDGNGAGLWDIVMFEPCLQSN